jgi:hypothetical protein
MAKTDDQNQNQNLDNTPGDMDFESIIKSMMEQTEQKQDDQVNENELENDVDDEQDGDSLEDEQDEEDEEQDEQPEPDKEKTQTPEERKAQAAQRRQREFDARVQAELDKRMTDLPEMQVARELAKMYNTTPDKMLEVVRNAELDRQAQAQAQRDNVPVEVVKKTLSLEQELNQLKFQQWQDKTEAQRPQIMKDFPMLTEGDVNAAIVYQVQVLKQLDMPLDQAVLALHGKKVLEGLKKNAQQEVLAEKGGRKKSALPMQGGGKSSTSVALTPDERAVARGFGMSDEEYLKYKTNE